MTDQKRRSKAEQREDTTQRLMQVGREVFAAKGYADASTEEIVHQAGVTRGALYHHFESKEGLFRAVVAELHRELAARVAAAAPEGDLWQQLVMGCRVFLAAALDAPTRRIVLIDGPAVLGWEHWRALDSASSMPSLHDVLALLIDQGTLRPLPVDALTHLLSGAMNEAALWIADAPEPEAALAEATHTLESLLVGLLA